MTRTSHTIDRTGWESGPWDNEPDRLEWRDAETGLPCLIVRAWTGALCGYVGVPPEHPLHGTDYDAVPLDVASAPHGGLTYAQSCDETGTICHAPAPGEDENVWWFGFDCAHFMDRTPGMDTALSWTYGTYRTVAYVQEEVARLARALQEARTA